jgi:hypothetical protein
MTSRIQAKDAFILLICLTRPNATMLFLTHFVYYRSNNRGIDANKWSTKKQEVSLYYQTTILIILHTSHGLHMQQLTEMHTPPLHSSSISRIFICVAASNIVNISSSHCCSSQSFPFRYSAHLQYAQQNRFRLAYLSYLCVLRIFASMSLIPVLPFLYTSTRINNWAASIIGSIYFFCFGG